MYNPDLGDGRGFLHAQLRDAVDGRLLDLATKGSGQTPWSRNGDGRLTLKGGVREILATEMLEALGVSTSKSFSLFETGEMLFRGDEPSPPPSVLVRLATRTSAWQSPARLPARAARRRAPGLRGAALRSLRRPPTVTAGAFRMRWRRGARVGGGW